ncbi:MAG TPA: glycosyltransferase family 4 protein [Gaiellaceae bacterium]|nr:glycosyltransferase family 4 protein [Gaiellaceae bacterium]
MSGDDVRPLLLGLTWFPDRTGGLNRYLRELFLALEADGARPRAVVLGPADPPTRVAAVASDKAPLPARLVRYAQAAATAGRQADVVDAHFALHAFLPVVLGPLRRRPLVVHFQGPWASESRISGDRTLEVTAKWLIERSVYRRARHAIVLSSAFKRLLVERYGVLPWAVSVVPPGVDLDRFRPAESVSAARAGLGLSADAWVAFSPRRLVPRTGIDVLLDAWPRLLETGDGRPSTLLVAGDGPSRRELEARAARLGVSATVRFLGEVSEEVLRTCYQAADVCVVPSLALEGFGLVVLEALACGVPVVASDAGGLPAALGALDPGLIVPAGNARALSRRLEDARTGTRPVPDRGRCRAYAERFSWKEVASRHRALYASARWPENTRDLRVVYVDHCAQLSGAEIALLRLLPALSGIEAHVILAEDGPLVSRLLSAGVSVEVLPMREGARRLPRERVRPGPVQLARAAEVTAYAFRLARRLRRLRPDLVHTNSLKAAVYGSLAAKAARVPIVWHARDRISPDYLPSPAVTLVRAVGRIAPDAVVAVSDAALATLRDGRPEGALPPSFVVRDPIPRAPQVRRDRESESRLGMVGRIAPWKGQHVFLEGFARAFGDGNERAVIIGAPLFGEEEDEYERSLRELAARLGVADRVEFAGFREDVWHELERLDVLVHASVIPEPGGQVVAEGMAAGLPVVAAAGGGPAEVIADEVTGLLFPPGDSEALADDLARLVSDPGLRRRLSEAARERARDFAPEAIAGQVMQVYRAVLAARATRKPG